MHYMYACKGHHFQDRKKIAGQRNSLAHADLQRAKLKNASQSVIQMIRSDQQITRKITLSVHAK